MKNNRIIKFDKYERKLLDIVRDNNGNVLYLTNYKYDDKYNCIYKRYIDANDYTKNLFVSYKGLINDVKSKYTDYSNEEYKDYKNNIIKTIVRVPSSNSCAKFLLYNYNYKLGYNIKLYYNYKEGIDIIDCTITDINNNNILIHIQKHEEYKEDELLLTINYIDDTQVYIIKSNKLKTLQDIESLCLLYINKLLNIEQDILTIYKGIKIMNLNKNNISDTKTTEYTNTTKYIFGIKPIMYSRIVENKDSNNVSIDYFSNKILVLNININKSNEKCHSYFVTLYKDGMSKRILSALFSDNKLIHLTGKIDDISFSYKSEISDNGEIIRSGDFIEEDIEKFKYGFVLQDRNNIERFKFKSITYNDSEEISIYNDYSNLVYYSKSNNECFTRIDIEIGIETKITVNKNKEFIEYIYDGCLELKDSSEILNILENEENFKNITKTIYNDNGSKDSIIITGGTND